LARIITERSLLLLYYEWSEESESMPNKIVHEASIFSKIFKNFFLLGEENKMRELSVECNNWFFKCWVGAILWKFVVTN
jgi:hypothetical protein